MSDGLGNGCGDFGFIEDLSTLIALKILVDDLDFETQPVDRASITVLAEPHLERMDNESHKPNERHSD